ncbi:MAG: septation protein A [Magnetococcales bacterium]|nr:septation protein A [Magnetococcales bacterium]NGZ29599.1 septation protein A [Magnetococcales bacterium]
MKILIDLLPVVIFFVVYKLEGIFYATAAAIAAGIGQSLYTWVKYKKLEEMQLFTLIILVVFGGATLLFQDPLFIKWKPTMVEWLLAAMFYISSIWRGRTPLVRKMFGGHLELPEDKWHTLNWAWILFFLLAGLLNLVVAYLFDENTWVNFKLFGLTGLTMLFAIGQAYWLSDYLTEKEEPPKP